MTISYERFHSPSSSMLIYILATLCTRFVPLLPLSSGSARPRRQAVDNLSGTHKTICKQRYKNKLVPVWGLLVPVCFPFPFPPFLTRWSQSVVGNTTRSLLVVGSSKQGPKNLLLTMVISTAAWSTVACLASTCVVRFCSARSFFAPWNCCYPYHQLQAYVVGTGC